MREQRDNFVFRFLISIFIIISLFGILVGVHNYLLKNKLKNVQKPQYIYKANELKKILKNKYFNTNVIKTKEYGDLDQKGKKLKFIPELIMGEGELQIGEGDTNKIFNNITAIIADKEGNIYISDYAECRVRKFNKYGKFIKTFSRKGYGPGDLSMPISMAFDYYGNICVLDYGNQIEKFSSEGAYLETIQLKIGGKGSRDAFVIDKSGNFFISVWDNDTDMVIHQFDSTGILIDSFCEAVRFKDTNNLSSRAIKRMISAGPLAIYKNELFFARHNPYEIRKYTTNDSLKMIILRKNKFMLPATSIPLRDGYELRMPVTCVHLWIWRDNIIVDVAIPGEYRKERIDCHLVDIIDQKGNLLTTFAPSKYSIDYIDHQGNVYSSFRDDLGFTKIGRFKLKLVDKE